MAIIKKAKPKPNGYEISLVKYLDGRLPVLHLTKNNKKERVMQK